MTRAQYGCKDRTTLDPAPKPSCQPGPAETVVECRHLGLAIFDEFQALNLGWNLETALLQGGSPDRGYFVIRICINRYRVNWSCELHEQKNHKTTEAPHDGLPNLRFRNVLRHVRH